MKENKNRRQFLRNSALSLLGLSALPLSIKAASKKQTAADRLLDCDQTTQDYYGEGPFYTINPPSIANNQLAPSNEPGTKLIISGRVFNLDCSAVIPNAVVDIWHADDAGTYDNSGYHLRGQTQTNNQGFYIFETIKPGRYLNGPTYRPSHIHFKITPPSFSTLTTQLYFQGDPYIANDAAASITTGAYDASDRIIPLTTNAGTLEGTWDIVISGNGIPTGTSNIHIDKGIIYSASPNPYSDSVRIHYGIFKESEVSIMVYDVAGRLVANLEESKLSPDKYEAFWAPDQALPNGHYFVALKVNALQVHYLKIVYQK
jgi:protocatechuate 3,4-dioxygenase beta subunit